jgi:hypothetical protein
MLWKLRSKIELRFHPVVDREKLADRGPGLGGRHQFGPFRGAIRLYLHDGSPGENVQPRDIVRETLTGFDRCDGTVGRGHQGGLSHTQEQAGHPPRTPD